MKLIRTLIDSLYLRDALELRDSYMYIYNQDEVILIWLPSWKFKKLRFKYVFLFIPSGRVSTVSFWNLKKEIKAIKIKAHDR